MDNTYLFHGNAAVGGAVERLAANAGWQRVDSLADADVVVTYCTNQQALEDAYFDEGGFVQTARTGTLMIDLSPSTPGFARELSAVALVSELHPVEAPIAVLDPTWEDAFSRPDNLICFVAGEEDDVAAAKPFLQAIAGEVLEEGPLGSAQLARAARTVQQVGTLVATAESEALCHAVRRAAGAGNLAEDAPHPTSESAQAYLEAIVEKRFEGTYTLEMMMGELAAALTAADDADLILPQTEACMHLLELLAVIGGSDKAPIALSLVYGEEEACAEQGLDWTRAEHFYGEQEDGAQGVLHDHGRDHDHDHGDGDDYDEYGSYDDYDGYTGYDNDGVYHGGYGSYSPN